MKITPLAATVFVTSLLFAGCGGADPCGRYVDCFAKIDCTKGEQAVLTAYTTCRAKMN